MGLISYKEWEAGNEEISCECSVSLRGNTLFFENESGNFDLELQPEQAEDIKQKMQAMQDTAEEMPEEEPRERIPDTPDAQPPLIKAPTAL